MHDPEDVLALLRKISAFFRGVSKGQAFSCFVLRHVPGASEKMVRKFEEFMVDCIHEYKAMRPGTYIKFRHRQEFLLVRREIDLYLSRLFWGSFNNNRDLLSGEQWATMNKIAVEMSYIIDLLKGEFDYGTETETRSF